MKKFLLLLFLALFLYILILVAPVGIFFYSLHSLNFSEKTPAQELSALSLLVVIEEPAESQDETHATESQTQVVTFTIPDEEISAMFYDDLTARQLPGLTLDTVETTISPEMISLTISWHCQFFGYQFYEVTVLSEWLVRFSEAKVIEVKPTNIHTNHLYSVDWVMAWEYVNRAEKPDGWLALTSFAHMNVQDIVLKDREVALTIGVMEDGMPE